MEAQRFVIKDFLRRGWLLTKANLGFLLGYEVIMFLVMLAFSGQREGLFWSLWHLLGLAIVVIIKMGFYKSALLIDRGITPDLTQLYANWRLIVSWVLSGIFFGVMFFVGLVLFVIPGLYVLSRFGLYPFFIVDRELGPIEALKASSHATEGVRWPFFLLMSTCIVLNIIGVLLLGIGLLFTAPVTLIALAAAYRSMTD